MERMDLADAPWRLWHCMVLQELLRSCPEPVPGLVQYTA